MFCIISGASASGKSEYAEETAIRLSQRSGSRRLVYIATMLPFGEEAVIRIRRHRLMRNDKGFETVECPLNLKGLTLPPNTTALLECMSNLVANEMFEEEGAGRDTVPFIMEGIEKIRHLCDNLVIVTNDVFSDGIDYDGDTVKYIKNLGNINVQMASLADVAVEVVCSIPVILKGGDKIKGISDVGE